MTEGVNKPDIVPNRLPVLKIDQVKERAQQIFNEFGYPPYDSRVLFPLEPESIGIPYAIDEVMTAIINEFVFHWLPFLDKSNGGPRPVTAWEDTNDANHSQFVQRTDTSDGNSATDTGNKS